MIFAAAAVVGVLCWNIASAVFDYYADKRFHEEVKHTSCPMCQHNRRTRIW